MRQEMARRNSIRLFYMRLDSDEGLTTRTLRFGAPTAAEIDPNRQPTALCDRVFIR